MYTGQMSLECDLLISEFRSVLAHAFHGGFECAAYSHAHQGRGYVGPVVDKVLQCKVFVESHRVGVEQETKGSTLLRDLCIKTMRSAIVELKALKFGRMLR